MGTYRNTDDRFCQWSREAWYWGLLAWVETYSCDLQKKTKRKRGKLVSYKIRVKQHDSASQARIIAIRALWSHTWHSRRLCAHSLNKTTKRIIWRRRSVAYRCRKHACVALFSAWDLPAALRLNYPIERTQGPMMQHELTDFESDISFVLLTGPHLCMKTSPDL